MPVIKRCSACRKEGHSFAAPDCQHKEASWYISYRIGGRGSKQVLKKIGPRKADAEAALGEIERSLAVGDVPATKKISFQEIAKKWFDQQVVVNCRYGTQRLYRSHLQNHLLPAIGHLPLSAITLEEAERLKAQYARGDLSVSTRNLLMIILKTILKYARVRGYKTCDFHDALKKTPLETKEQEFLTVKELGLLLKYSDEPYRTLFLVAALTGLRAGELFGLQWGDIDWASNCVYVRRQCLRRRRRDVPAMEPAWSFEDLKTRHSARKVTMLPIVREALQVHQLNQTKTRHDLVFCSSAQTPLIGENVTYAEFHPALERAGLRRIRFHDLRHTFATFLVSGGANVKFIQEQLGHSSIRTTLDVYGHLLPSVANEETEKLQKMLSGAIFPSAVLSGITPG